MGSKKFGERDEERHANAMRGIIGKAQDLYGAETPDVAMPEPCTDTWQDNSQAQQKRQEFAEKELKLQLERLIECPTLARRKEFEYYLDEYTDCWMAGRKRVM